MNYIILDLEWNQSGTPEESVKELTFEIVEIGAVKLNNDRVMVDEFSRLVKPQVYSKMHHITRKLIHLRMEELEKGKPFADVSAEFKEWCGRDYMFGTWGPLDLSEYQNNLRYFGLKALSDGPIAFFDVQKLFSIQYEDGKSRKSLEYAVDFLKIEKDIPFHRAFSDAYYTAKVFAKINEDLAMSHISYDTYRAPKDEDHEIWVDFDKYSKFISRGFETKQQLLSNKKVMSTKCYKCGGATFKRIKWFSPNHKNYYYVGFCPRHGYVKSKVRVRKDCHELYFCVKTMKKIDRDTFRTLAEKYTKYKENKKKALKKAKEK